METSDRTEAFCERLWKWFAVHKRVLPWRDLKIKNNTERAYRILVSEVMLQQTQVPRVIIIYKRFLEQFPTIKDLAKASNKEVIIAWRGMGYNSRALRLRDAAREIVTLSLTKGDHFFPKEFSDLIAIKGIGKYTAGAIRNFAFNIPTPCIDTNIRRILHRIFIGPEKSDGTFPQDDKKLMPFAGNVLRIAVDRPLPAPRGGAPLPQGGGDGGGGWHAALMDFGSLVCTKRSPKCEICPMAKNGLCKSAFRVRPPLPRGGGAGGGGREPGVFVGSKFIPNRIFRGRVIDALRDAHKGLTLDQIGAIIRIDWDAEEHHEWLEGLLKKLESDGMLAKRKTIYSLA